MKEKKIQFIPIYKGNIATPSLDERNRKARKYSKLCQDKKEEKKYNLLTIISIVFIFIILIL